LDVFRGYVLCFVPGSHGPTMTEIKANIPVAEWSAPAV
jgi:hypothetical protein